jgi:hypothetical protein
MDDIIAIYLLLFLATLSVICVILSKACLCCSICISKNSSGYPERILLERSISENHRLQTSRPRNYDPTAWKETSVDNFKTLNGSIKIGPESQLNGREIFA